MAKELMQCRHELEASRRVQSEYAERTHAAESAAAKASARMHEIKTAYQQLRDNHEKKLEELQRQQNRVAKLRVALTRRERAASNEADESADGAMSPERAAPRLQLTSERPEWNNDVVICREPSQKRAAKSVRAGASSSILGTRPSATSATEQPELLLDPTKPPPSGVVTSEAATRELHSLQHQLSSARSEKAAAERAAEERQVQCDNMQLLVAESDAQRDAQAELAAAAAAEASALRQQLQTMRENVEALHEERNLQNGVQDRALASIRRESACQARVLAVDLRALEDMCARKTAHATAHATGTAPQPHASASRRSHAGRSSSAT